MPPRRVPAVATSFVIALMPPSKTVTPSASSIRKTLKSRRGNPPRSRHTPSATFSRSPLAALAAALVLALSAAASACSGGRAVGRQQRRPGARWSCCRGRRRWRRARPSATTKLSTTSASMRAPLGVTPWNLPGPANVPVMRERIEQRSASAVRRQPGEREIGDGREQLSKYARDPSGAIRSAWPWMAVAAAGLPQGDHRVEVARVERREVRAGDLGRRRLGGPAARARFVGGRHDLRV